MYNTELRVSYAHHTQFAVSDLHFATVYGLRTDLGGCKIFRGGGRGDAPLRESSYKRSVPGHAVPGHAVP